MQAGLARWRRDQFRLVLRLAFVKVFTRPNLSNIAGQPRLHIQVAESVGKNKVRAKSNTVIKVQL